MAKIIIDDEALDRICENISYSLQTELLTASQAAHREILAAIMAGFKKKKESDLPQPEFLKKMIVKNPDGNGNQKRS